MSRERNGIREGRDVMTQEAVPNKKKCIYICQQCSECVSSEVFARKENILLDIQIYIFVCVYIYL